MVTFGILVNLLLNMKNKETANLPDIQTIIDNTLRDYDYVTRSIESAQNTESTQHTSFTFQWPWDIASAGAKHVHKHMSAITGLASGGAKISPSTAAAVASGPTNPANTNKVINDSIFGQALDAVKADQLLRTVVVGWSTGVQVGLFGGGGGTGVAYDIISPSNRTGVGYSSFNIGIGAGVNVGLIVGAMTAQPKTLNHSTCVWSVGGSVAAIGVTVQVIMDNSDLSLIGFGLAIGGGIGISSSSGYGEIKTI